MNTMNTINTINPRIAKREVTRHILKKFGIRLSKKMGQNFLTDEKVVDAITSAARIGPGDKILEIGPGIGTLTQRLAETGASVTAVELDARLVEVLRKTLSGYANVKILHGDILKTDIAHTMRDIGGAEPARYKVVANLPYYITTPILMKLLEEKLPVDLLVIMVQKEVARRITAPPGGKDYGALSVAVQYYSDPEIVFNVAAAAFLPPPAVESAVVRCVVRTAPPVSVTDEKTFFKVVKAAFCQRRKTLFNALTAAGLPKDGVKAVLSAAGIDGQRRGEQLSLEEFSTIANAWDKLEC